MRVLSAVLLAAICWALSGTLAFSQQPSAAESSKEQLPVLSVRAGVINPDAQQYPELGYVFTDDKGKPQDQQFAIAGRGKSRGQLVIWLMGYNKQLFERIAGYGLHGIQPHYANKWFGTIPDEIRDNGDSLGSVRLEAATGDDHSPLVAISPADGLAARSIRFVQWLRDEQPQGNWEQFLNEQQDALLWDKVILAGSSHGSTTAARFAKHKRVARVVMFSGPRDQFESWQSLPSATPPNRYFGFTHVLDTGWTGDHYCRSWLMLGLNEFGPLVDVDADQVAADDAEAPFGNSRRLITNSDVGNQAERAHSASVPGNSAVKNEQGEFIHEAVWEYLFTHPVDQVGSPVPAEQDCQLNLRK